MYRRVILIGFKRVIEYEGDVCIVLGWIFCLWSKGKVEIKNEGKFVK